MRLGVGIISLTLALALAACGGGGGGSDGGLAGPVDPPQPTPVDPDPVDPDPVDPDPIDPDPTGPTAYIWDLPPGFPVPLVPEDNPMTFEKVELGRHLFYDRRMSLNQEQSCGDCHEQRLAFTDGRALALGSTGEEHPRNASSLTNVAYNPTLTWMNPLLVALEEQVLIPMFGEDPIELGFSGREEELLERFRSEPLYQAMFIDAFPESDEPVSIDAIAKAVSSFQRTLISGNSAYDKFVYQGDDDALTENALRGANLVINETELECNHCHGSLNFASSLTHEGNPNDPTPFENNGIYNVGGTGLYPEPNIGLEAFTGDPRDNGKMKPPTLRNIEVTAPYMHDGSIPDLDGVLDHYLRAGRLVIDGPYAGDGRENPNKSEFITGFPLSNTVRGQVIEFLESLTDYEFLTDPRFSNPFPED